MFTEVVQSKTRKIKIIFEGKTLEVRENLSLAAALLASGIADFRRTPVSESPRGPYCMMGVCFDCLVIVDDLPNQQACLLTVREGMRVERQTGTAELLNITDQTDREKI